MAERAENDAKYEKLLDNLYSGLPKDSAETGERFEVPVPSVKIEGNRTIIDGFDQICAKVRRPAKHVMKKLLKDLAAPGQMEGSRLVLIGKIPARLVVQKFNSYVKEYVICSECGKPDTHILSSDRTEVLRCEACGAKRALRN